jgi:hypothetical protein
MESTAFRNWLREHGCRFDSHEHEQRHHGPMMVTVHREGKTASVPLGGSRQKIEAQVMRKACEELGIDPALLPDSRV